MRFLPIFLFSLVACAIAEDVPQKGAGQDAGSPDTGPFVLELSFATTDVTRLYLEIDNAPYFLGGAADSTIDSRFCLGEMNADAALEFFPASIEILRAELLPADEGECPKPGQVQNGEAEPGGGGWGYAELFGSELASGIGKDGSGAMRIVDSNAWTTISVPRSTMMASPALRFWSKGLSGTNWRMTLFGAASTAGRFTTDHSIRPQETPSITTLCLPPWTRGVATWLQFDLISGPDTPPNELIVDALEIVDEPACGTSSEFLNPGFENTEIQPLALGAYNYSLTGVDDSTAAVVSDPLLARTGDGVLEFSITSNKQFARLYDLVRVPEGVGPALEIYSNIPAALSSLTPTVSTDEGDFLLPLGGGWQRSEICLPRDAAGRWSTIRIGTVRAPGEEIIFPRETYYVDDLALITSEDCP